jgi:hypothetical protein
MHGFFSALSESKCYLGKEENIMRRTSREASALMVRMADLDYLLMPYIDTGK